jgi:hypothetical protein
MGLSNDGFQNQASVIGASIDIQLKNKDGINLLGNHKYPIDKITATDNLEQKKSNNNGAILLDYPNNIMFVDENKIQFIRVFLNNSASEKFPLTYIHWNKTETDTIKAEYHRTGNSVILARLWIFKNNSWEEIKSKPLTIIK